MTQQKNPNTFDYDEQDNAGDQPSSTYIAPDEPFGVHSFGTTLAEERAGEIFSDRMKHTLPEVHERDAYVPNDVGRLVQPGDEEVDLSDEEVAAVARSHQDDEDFSAEELAMHTIDEP